MCSSLHKPPTVFSVKNTLWVKYNISPLPSSPSYTALLQIALLLEELRVWFSDGWLDFKESWKHLVLCGNESMPHSVSPQDVEWSDAFIPACYLQGGGCMASSTGQLLFIFCMRSSSITESLAWNVEQDGFFWCKTGLVGLSHQANQPPARLLGSVLANAPCPFGTRKCSPATQQNQLQFLPYRRLPWRPWESHIRTEF